LNILSEKVKVCEKLNYMRFSHDFVTHFEEEINHEKD